MLDKKKTYNNKDTKTYPNIAFGVTRQEQHIGHRFKCTELTGQLTIDANVFVWRIQRIKRALMKQVVDGSSNFLARIAIWK